MRRYAIDAALILACAGLVSGRFALAAPGRSPLPYAAFAQPWYFHDGSLAVSPTGHGEEHFRVGIDCTPSRLTTCDQFLRNTIYPGGFFTFTLHRMQGARAFGTIETSAYSWQVGTRIELVLSGGGKGTVRIYALTGPPMACNNKAPAGTCGA